MSLSLSAKGYWAMGDFNAAKNKSLECVKYCKKHQLLDELGYIYNMIGGLNLEQRKSVKALYYFRESEKIRVQLNDQLQLGSVYSNE